MVAWRVAGALLELGAQWAKAHPKAARPGYIGDEKHAARTSDHNPWVVDPGGPNVVTAGDFYHQPSIGADAYALAQELKERKDPRVKYVISQGRIWSLARNKEGWRPYNGENPHTGHTHVSVSPIKSLYDSRRPWLLPGATAPHEEDILTVEQMEELKAHISAEANYAARKWALWAVRYGVQTEDERARAQQAYQDAIDAGKSPDEAMAQVVAVMRPLDSQLAADQAKKV